MSSDLVERLCQVDPPGGGDNATRWYRNPDGPEAANYIKALEYRVSGLESDVRQLKAELNTTIELEGAFHQLAETRANHLRYVLQRLTAAAAELSNHDNTPGFHRSRAHWSRLHNSIRHARIALDGQEDD